MIEKITCQMPRMLREAQTMPESANNEKREIKIAWATDRPVMRYNFEIGAYWEVLSMDKKHVRLDRFKKGLSLLDSHNWNSTDSIIGIAEKPVFNGGHESTCTLRFSKNNPKADRVWADIQDGIIRHYSFGYEVHAYEQTGEGENGLPIMTAIDWEPSEVSVVPVPADPDAGIRAQGAATHPCEIIRKQEITMADEKKIDAEQAEEKAAVKADEIPVEKDEQEEPKKGKKTQEQKPVESVKAEISAEERAEIAKVERERIAAIRQAGSVFKLKDSEIEKMVNDGMSADAARAAMISNAHAQQAAIAPVASVEVNADEWEKKSEAMTAALLFRANPGKYKNTGTEFRGMSQVDMARYCLQNGNAKSDVRGLTHMEIAKRAFRGGAWSTSDFGNVLYGAINTVLRDSYALAPKTYEPFSRRATVSDFRPRYLVQMGDVDKFDVIPEGGEYTRGKASDAKEQYAVKKYGKIIPITWEAIVNDYLDAFSRIPASIAAEAAQTTSDVVYGLLTGNGKMSDGKNVFSTQHANIASSGSDLSVSSMDAAFQAIAAQKNLAGRELNLTPSFIVGGHGMRSVASKYLGDTIYPTSAADVVPGYMRSLSFIPESRIKTGWYVICAPTMIDTIEYAYLEGEEGLYTETENGFDVDGIQIKARMVFGAGIIDYRGMYYNAGV